MMLALLMTLAAATAQPASDADFDPDTGYRIAHYRGVIPHPPEGISHIAVDEVAKLHAVLIDVTPAEGAVRDPTTGRWRLAEPHQSIPGAHWFPEAGRGRLEPDIERWFLSGVERLAGRHPDKPIVVFCLADCWMSWNASLRLRRAGFPHVRWFAEGIDGWRESGRVVRFVQPNRDETGNLKNQSQRRN